MPWLINRVDMTPDQSRATELPTTENRLICGLPGSGKTQILLHRAAHLRDASDVPPDRYCVFLFTNVLRDYVRSGVQYLGLDEASVLTFDHWCRLFHEAHLPGVSLPFQDGKPNFAGIRSEVLHLLKTKPELRHRLEFALVDEGQDLTRESYQILTLAAKHVTVFADFLQRIFNDGAVEDSLRQELGIRHRNVTLLGAYRSSQDIARMAGVFLSSEERREQYVNSSRPSGSVRERPVLFRASSPDKEMDRLAEVIRGRMVQNETVGIILPQNRLVYGLAKGLKERGLDIDLAVPPRAGQAPADYDSMTPKIATYHSAKGLTFDSVILPRLVVTAFGSFAEDESLRMLFVGIARARKWAYLSTYGLNPLPELSRLDGAIARQELMVHTDSSPPPPSVSSQDDEDDEISLL